MFSTKRFSSSAKVLKATSQKFRNGMLVAGFVLFTGICGQLSAQVPVAMENDMDNLTSAVYEALKVIDTKSEAEALAQLAVIKPRIEAQAKAYAEKWAGTELSDEDDMAIGKKMLEKPLYKDLFALIASPAFKSKIENSPALMKAYAEIVSMSALEAEYEAEASDSPAMSGSTVLSFTISGAVPYAGTYSVSGNEEQAFANIDLNELFSVEVSSTLNGGEFQFLLLSEEAKTGSQKWSMESQIIIQSWDRNENEVIQMDTYYNEGTITFDAIEGVGGKVSGSFEGKFFDGTQVTDQPLKVSGKFSVTRIDDAY